MFQVPIIQPATPTILYLEHNLKLHDMRSTHCRGCNKTKIKT